MGGGGGQLAEDEVVKVPVLPLKRELGSAKAGSAEAMALETFINGDIPVEVVKGNMNPGAFRDYFAEVLQPIALVLGKKVSSHPIIL